MKNETKRFLIRTSFYKMVLEANKLIEELTRQLTNLDQQKRTLNKFTRQLTEYEETRIEKEKVRDQFMIRLAAEKRDVDRLNQFTLSNILYSISGKKLEKLDKEEREYVAVRVKVDLLAKEIAAILNKEKELKAKREMLGDVNHQYNLVLAKKEQLLLSIDREFSFNIHSLLNAEYQKTAQIQEYEEAIIAGEVVIHSLGKAKSALNNASNWGTFDLLGGGMISSAIKHNHLEEATSIISDVQTKLVEFHKELIDIGHVWKEVNVDISGFLKFADYFLDDIFSDWAVQQKITDITSQVTLQEKQVDVMLNKLRRNLALLQKEVKSLKHDREAIIVSTTEL